MTRDGLRVREVFAARVEGMGLRLGEQVVIRSGRLDGQEATVEVVNSKTVGVSLETGLRVVVDAEGLEKAA